MHALDHLWKAFTKSDAEEIIQFRSHEIKLGQSMRYVESAHTEELKRLAHIGVQYVIFGLPECIGPMANLGRPGCENAWNAFVPSFLNMQHNQWIDPRHFSVIGSVDLNEEQDIGMNLSSRDKNYFDSLRQIVESIDRKVSLFASEVLNAGLIPIVIGGGHNNAYPLIKASAEYSGRGIQVVNCDPHADFRPLEGRHSGNPFSYAVKNDFLRHYSVIGLHQNYNSQESMDMMREAGMHFNFWEDINDWELMLDHSKAQLSQYGLALGIELDMDALAYMPSSAMSPEGLSLQAARAYIRKMATFEKIAYVHLPEAAPITDADIRLTAKALSYLVSDFVKVRKLIDHA